MNDKDKLLQAPFYPEDIEWKPQQIGIKNGKPWARVVPYVTNRAIQKRLDEVFGVFGWENVFEQTNPTINKKKDTQKTIYGWKCGITIYEGDKKITKWDGAEETDIEPLKGGMSNSMKRAAVQFGIGRYLYHAKPMFAICVIVPSRRECNDEYPNFASATERNAQASISFAWANPPLPEWALPNANFSKFLEPVKKAKTIDELKLSFAIAYKQAESSGITSNTKELIKTKDSRKKAIEKNLQEQYKANFKTVSDWLKDQVNSLQLIPTVKATKTIQKTIKTTLEGKMKGFNIQTDELLLSFDESCESRIKEIQAKADAATKKQQKEN